MEGLNAKKSWALCLNPLFLQEELHQNRHDCRRVNERALSSNDDESKLKKPKKNYQRLKDERVSNVRIAVVAS